ncbi:MAG: hypothetical protein WKF88_09325 [Ferruginibacter sp.]
MIIEKEIEIARALLATGLVEKVYHSVELVEDKAGAKFPAYKKGSEQYYVGPDDSKKMFAYIRHTGTVVKLDEKSEGSCRKTYQLGHPLRVVLFQDHVKEDIEALARRMLAIVFLKDVHLVSVTTNAFQLGKQESPLGDFSFDATTFYLAIDIQVRLWISLGECEEDTCIVHPNPICL